MTGVVEGGPAVAAAGHELLVRLAGRLPDDVLWRLRDWLAAGALGSVAAVLPRELLRHRLGLTDDERELLWHCVAERSPSRRLLDAVLPLPELDDPGVAFSAGHRDPRPRRRWRRPRSPRATPVPRSCARRGAARGASSVSWWCSAPTVPWDLTGTLQRLLRAHGDRTPCVEVLPLEMEVPGYHQAAVVGSSVLYARPPAPADGSGAAPTPDSAGVFAPGALTGT